MSLPKLIPSHRAALVGIPDDTVEELEFYTEDDRDNVARDLNIDTHGDDAGKLFAALDEMVPVLAIPYPGTDGYVVFRRDEPRVSGALDRHDTVYLVDAPDGRTLPANPTVKGAYLRHVYTSKDGKQVKYESPRGVPVPLYVPSRFRGQRHGGPLYIHEGAKKAASGHGLGMNSVGLGGVSNWGAPVDEKIKAADPTPSPKAELLEECRAAGNEAVIVFDTPDMTKNPDVIGHAVKLAKALTAEGVKVQVGYVPAVKGQAKSGFDDWVAATGPTPGEARLRLCPRPADPAAAVEWAKEAKATSARDIRELATWAYIWVRGDATLFEKWVKRATKALDVPAETFEEAVEHLAKVEAVDLVAYDVRADAYLLRHSVEKPFALWSVPKNAAVAHLGEVGGMSRKAAAKVVATQAMAVIYGRDCRPDASFVYKDADGVTIANTYVPPKLVPTFGGSWSAIDRLLDGLTGGDAAAKKWLTHWLAYKVQNPGARMNSAVVLQGMPGWGKDTLVRAMRYILGEENTTTIGQNDLDSSFNDYADKLFIFADEVLNRENINDKSGPLKGYLASSVVRINPKGRPAYEVPNRSAWVFATNYTNPVKLERGDRRYSVFANFNVPDEDHKRAVGAMWKNGSDFTDAAVAEVAHWAWYLLMCVKPDRNLIQRPYENEARADLMDINKTSVESFADLIRDLGVEVVCGKYVGDAVTWDFGDRGVSSDALYDVYKTWCASTGLKHPLSASRFGVELRRLFPDMAPRGASRIRGADGKCRLYVYRGLPRASRPQAPVLSLVPAPVVEAAPSPAESTQLELPFTGRVVPVTAAAAPASSGPPMVVVDPDIEDFICDLAANPHLA